MKLKKNLKKRLRLKLKKYALKYFFNDFKEILLFEVINSIKIETTNSTLFAIEKCINQNKKGAYMRFGDGDVFLLKNRNDSLQKSNKILADEMKEAFLINDANVFKSLAIHSDLFGCEEGMFDGNHKNTDSFSLYLLKATYMFFIGQKIYSPVALHFTATENPTRANSFLKLIKSKAKVFIGNEKLSNNTITKLFGNVQRIDTPSKNSYVQIDRIYEESIEQINLLDNFHVIIVAMGCSGRPLMKRLYQNSNKSFFLFDFGSLIDGFDGVENRTWLKVNNINYDMLIS